MSRKRFEDVAFVILERKEGISGRVGPASLRVQAHHWRLPDALMEEPPRRSTLQP